MCDGGYYEQFNKDNFDVVQLKETPITEIVENGIKTSDGKLHELDVIIIATGYDAMDGNYTRVPFQGRSGKTLKDHWKDGPKAFLGMTIADFPNLFTITGRLTVPNLLITTDMKYRTSWRFYESATSNRNSDELDCRRN